MCVGWYSLTRMNMFSFFTCRRRRVLLHLLLLLVAYLCFVARYFSISFVCGRARTLPFTALLCALPPSLPPSLPPALSSSSPAISACPSASTCCYFETCLPSQLSSLRLPLLLSTLFDTSLLLLFLLPPLADTEVGQHLILCKYSLSSLSVRASESYNN